MRRLEKRTKDEVIDSVIRAIRLNGPLTRSEIDFHCGYQRTCENHLASLREMGVLHISGWEVRSVPGRREALFDLGDKPDVIKPLKPKYIRPAKRKKLESRVHVSWLGAI